MTQSLTEFIASIRLAESIEEERYLITTEQADMRTYIRDCDPYLRPRLISKMVFLNILGENVAYGQMEVLTLMSSDLFSFKRLGYMAAGVLLDESNELTVLLTHTLLKDLQSPNPRIQCLALTLLANLGTTEMCQSLVTEVQRLIETSNSAVMKRAAMAAVRIVRHLPETAESFKPSIQKLLKHGSHSVVIAAINLMEHMISSQPELAKSYHRYQAAFVKILRQLSQTKASREFAFTVFNDPFLQVRIIKVLSVIQKSTDDLDDVLESIVTGVDIKRNAGRALLFQAVETIVATAKRSSLRGLAFSQIGRLFKFKDANILYSALSVFSRVLYSGHEIVDRTSSDSIALQRYKSHVVHCLSHRDASIRRRALDVVSALVDDNNVETLIPEVIDYVKYADSEFRIELVAKIFTAIQRFAPNKIWNFDTIHRLLIENGNYVGSDLITTFCKILICTPSIHDHAVKQLMLSMVNYSDNQSLVQVAAWVIGEFATVELDSYDNMKRLMTMPHTTSQTKGYLIIAMSKLAVRFNHKDDTIEFLNKFLNDASLDIQQRAGEMVSLLAKDNICTEVLSPVETRHEDQEKARIISTENPSTPSSHQKSHQKSHHNSHHHSSKHEHKKDKQNTDQLIQMPAQQTPGQPNNDPVSDLLDLGDSFTPSNSNSTNNSSLRDLLSIMPDNIGVLVNQNPNQGQANNDPKSRIKPFPGSVVAMEKADYIMYFEIRKNPTNPKQMAIRVSVFNLGPSPFTNFSMKFGVPVGWVLKAQAPSSNVLEPVGGAPITQQIMLSTQTTTPLMMKTLINYQYGSQPITENGEINQAIFS
ncbi:Adaptin N terminal region family protein [Tritrichomonas foetus]|uniref:AP-1 complex subunit gamma n=1 Tax=Tritrichomonas foetus TaxID=1144522 RepID=A0A1J4KKF0_9EUKA|nr:Adaptin N terminal region family protein [Tritrichomonas foetus]|eukprot:OHT11707.1 Adaptin N terminal region family protein [Tritrichomonas foetus]